jgi:hypothetical protein
MEVKLNNKQISEIIQEWFDRNNKSIEADKENKRTHFWNKDIIAKTIKNNLKLAGHWKNKAKWHPPKDVKPTFKSGDDW